MFRENPSIIGIVERTDTQFNIPENILRRTFLFFQKKFIIIILFNPVAKFHWSRHIVTLGEGKVRQYFKQRFEAEAATKVTHWKMPLEVLQPW